MSDLLPAGYEALEPFVEQWCLEGTRERDIARGAATPEQREAFYEAGKGLVPQALELLDRKPVSELDGAERRLLNLLLSLAHVTLAVEMLGDGEAWHTRFRKDMRITRTPQDA